MQTAVPIEPSLVVQNPCHCQITLQHQCPGFLHTLWSLLHYESAFQKGTISCCRNIPTKILRIVPLTYCYYLLHKAKVLSDN